MKKQLIAGLTVTLTLIATTGVKAEEVVKATATTTEEKNQPITVEAVEVAKKNLDDASQSVASQKQVVEGFETEQTKSQEVVDTAQESVEKADELVAKATAEEIKSAEDGVALAEGVVETASELVEDATKAQEAAQTDVDKQKDVVANVAGEVDEKTTAVTTAQSDVDKAQAILDGTNSVSVVKEAEESEKALAVAKTNLETAEQELAMVKQADQERGLAIGQAESRVLTAQTDLASKTITVNQAIQNSSKTGSELATAETAYQKALNDYQAINTITLNADYVKALKEYTGLNSPNSAQLQKLSEGLLKANTFKANPNDATTTYAINDVPREILTEVSLFASDLLNQVRRQLGVTALTAVTSSSVAFADEVTDTAVARGYDNWVESGHDVVGITSVAQKYNLYGSNQVANYYEDWRGVPKSVTKSNVTVSDLKSYVYTALTRLLFNDHEWLHAQSLAGLRTFQTPSVEYVGVDVSQVNGNAGVHFLGIEDTQLTTQSTNFSTQAISNPSTAETLKQKLDQTKQVRDTAKVSDDSAKASLAEAQTAQRTAQTALTQAQAQLVTAKTVPVKTATAQTKRDNAQSTKDMAQERYDSAQTALTNLSADVKTKQANLAQAKQVLAGKKSDLEQVKNTLDQEKAELVNLEAVLSAKTADANKAKQILSDSQKALSEAKAYLEDLLNAPSKLASAKEKLEQAKSNLEDKTEAVKVAKEKLTELEVEEQKLKATYEELSKKYTAQLLAQRIIDPGLVSGFAQLKGEQTVPVVNEKGQITGYTNTSVVSSSQPVSAEKSEKAERTLPKTGSTSSLLMTAVGTILSSLGLVSVRRRK